MGNRRLMTVLGVLGVVFGLLVLFSEDFQFQIIGFVGVAAVVAVALASTRRRG